MCDALDVIKIWKCFQIALATTLKMERGRMCHMWLTFSWHRLRLLNGNKPPLSLACPVAAAFPLTRRRSLAFVLELVNEAYKLLLLLTPGLRRCARSASSVRVKTSLWISPEATELLCEFGCLGIERSIPVFIFLWSTELWMQGQSEHKVGREGSAPLPPTWYFDHVPYLVDWLLMIFV
jgi:hypothetical protein